MFATFGRRICRFSLIYCLSRSVGLYSLTLLYQSSAQFVGPLHVCLKMLVTIMALLILQGTHTIAFRVLNLTCKTALHPLKSMS